MIYLNNINDAQTLFIPKNGPTSGSLKLQLKNTIDRIVTIDNVVDLRTSSLYFNLAVEFPDGVTEGEYEYTLLENNIVVASGLLVIGCNTANVNQYEKTMIYEQYKTN